MTVRHAARALTAAIAFAESAGVGVRRASEAPVAVRQLHEEVSPFAAAASAPRAATGSPEMNTALPKPANCRTVFDERS
jgi:hypothetical protein